MVTTELPKKSGDRLFNEAMGILRPSKAVQLHDYGREKPKIQITRERLIKTAFDRAWVMARCHVTKVHGTGGNAEERRELEKKSFARIVAGLYAKKRLFDKQRGFVSQENAYGRVSLNKKTGRKDYHKGVDSALQGLFKAGMTITQVSVVTQDLLFCFVDQIKRAKIDGVTPATTAAQFYGEHVKPRAQKWATELAIDQSVMARARHEIIFILYLGMKRELGERAVQRFKDKLRQQGERPEDRQLRIAFGRRDVQGFLANKEAPLPLTRVMEMVYGPPSTKVSPAFFDSLKPPEREVEVEASVPEVPGSQEEAMVRGWRQYISSFFATVKTFLKNLFG
jgi:hypothetical protein